LHFIEDFKDFILENIPTSELWAESIATTMISTMVTRDKYIRTSLGRLHLNTWFMMIGPSGLAAKTTPLTSMVFPILAEITQKINYPVIMPNRFSVEGFIEWLSKDHPWGCIIRDEASSLFKDANKEYLADMIEFLSELYDGIAQKRYTRKAKLEEAQDTYITFLGATTPYLYRIMKPEFFLQGTGNRFMYIIHETTRSNILSVEDVFLNIKRSMEMEDKMHEFAEMLTHVAENPIQVLMPNPEAAAMWVEFRKKCFDKAFRIYANDFLDIHYSYLTRLPEFALKLAGLYELSKLIETLPQFPASEFPISEESMVWGINKVGNHHKHFQMMLGQWSSMTTTIPITTLAPHADIMFGHIKKAKEDGIPWSEVYKKLMWPKSQLKNVLHTLLETERIIIIKKKGTRGSRLFDKKHEAKAIQYGDKAMSIDTAMMWTNLNR